MTTEIDEAIAIAEKVATQGPHATLASSLVLRRARHDAPGEAAEDVNQELCDSLTNDLENVAIACEWLAKLDALLVQSDAPTPLSKSLADCSTDNNRLTGTYKSHPYRSSTAALASALLAWLFDVSESISANPDFASDFVLNSADSWRSLATTVQTLDLSNPRDFVFCVDLAEGIETRLSLRDVCTAAAAELRDLQSQQLRTGRTITETSIVFSLKSTNQAGAKTTVNAWVKDPNFPPPVSDGPPKVWLFTEVRDWIRRKNGSELVHPVDLPKKN